MGWAARAHRQQRAQSQRFDRQAARELAGRLRSGLEVFGVPFSRAQPIGAMVSDLEWIAGFPAEPRDAGGAWEANPSRFDAAVVRSLYAHAIAEILHYGIRVQNGQRHAWRWIRKRIVGPEDDQAQDRLFEMVVAYRIALWHHDGVGFEVALDEEPDVVVSFPSAKGSGPLGFACKRPRSLHGLGKRLHEGVGQIRREGLRGIIVVSLDAYEDKPTTIAGVDVEAELRGRAFIRSVMESAAHAIEKEHDPVCLGIHFSARFHYRHRRGSGLLWVTEPKPALRTQEAKQGLAILDRLLLYRPEP